MPPNNKPNNFNSLTRKNRVELMKSPPVTRKRSLSRQEGNRNLSRYMTKKEFRFSNNTKNYNENTRGKVNSLPLPLPENWPYSAEYSIHHSNNILKLLNEHNYATSIRPNQKEFVETLSRLSGPSSRRFRPWPKGKYEKNNAKMMANLSAMYNDPQEMLKAVDSLQTSEYKKGLFKKNIRSMFEI